MRYPKRNNVLQFFSLFVLFVFFFAGQFIALVLVMCDIQNETKYFNFFLIGGFERFLSFKGAKVAYLIWVNLLLVLL